MTFHHGYFTLTPKAYTKVPSTGIQVWYQYDSNMLGITYKMTFLLLRL